MDLPAGIVTFLFTDIEGSSRLWEKEPDAMRAALARHNAILYQVLDDHGGKVFKTVGDGFYAAFSDARRAAAASVACQQALGSEPWPERAHIRVRIALHTGPAEPEGADYFGPALNRAARLLAIAHGGQTLLSGSAYSLCRDALPSTCWAIPMGEHRLKDLGRPEQVFQLCTAELRGEFPPLRSLESPELPNNLPLLLTSFIGRVRELQDLRDMLGRTRLVTLTGSGGSGKTRLAIQAAAELLGEKRDGVWLAELASLSDPEMVPRAVADVLGVKEEQGRPLIETVTEALRRRQLLLVLDNCEHLLNACARLAERLLQRCPDVIILATSREPLSIAGEQTYRVPSLPLPELDVRVQADGLPQYDGVRLFIERAQTQSPQFAVTGQNASAVVSICRRLDGIPLAIELAAARVRTLAVSEVNQRLDQRFRLLTGGSRTALPRQQTLRSLIDWSHDLLSADERALFRRLALFSGGWTLAAAERICAADPIEEVDVLEHLTSLVDKSLVLVDEHDGSARYRMLESIRVYGLEQLTEAGEQEALKSAHLSFFRDMALEFERNARGPQQVLWLDRIANERENVFAALDWAASGHGSLERGLELAAAICTLLVWRGGQDEGRRKLSALLARPEHARPQATADALNAAGVLAWQQADFDEARDCYSAALKLRRESGDEKGIAASLSGLGSVAYHQGDYKECRRYYEEALDVAQRCGDPYSIGSAHTCLGLLEWSEDNLAAAQAQYETALNIWRRIGHTGSIGTTINNLGILAMETGRYESARQNFETSRGIQLEIRDRPGLLMSLGNLGALAQSEGRYAESIDLFRETLAIARALGLRRHIGKTSDNLGCALWRGGEPEAGRELIEEGLQIARDLGNLPDLVHGLNNLGALSLESGQIAAARTYLSEALSVFQEIGEKIGAAISITTLASVLCAQGEPLGAAKLWGLAEHIRETVGAPLSPAERPRYDSAVREARACAADDTAFDTAWQCGRAVPLEDRIPFALGFLSD